MRIRPLAVDALIAAALTSVAMLLGPEAARQGQNPLDATAYALVVLVHLPLVLRGRAPVVVCCLAHATWLVYITAGYWPVVCSFGPMLAVYTVASLRALRVSVPCAALMGGVWIYAGAVSPTDSWPSVVGQAVVYPAVLWRFGVVARRSAELTRQLRREQAERARRAVAEERGRIARELHDVVAHHMSVISVQSGLARFVFDTDHQTARTALDTINATGKEALEELRRMLTVLRAADDGAPVGPMPGLARLEEMAERVRTGGVPVALTVEGTPRPLAPGVDLCAYRVVQEALTNVLKHAPGARAEVRLRYEPHQVAVSVTDDGEGVIPDRVRTDGGHGLLGMRERAKLYGGQISIGPQEQGGFAVRLTLPTSARAAGRGGRRQPMTTVLVVDDQFLIRAGLVGLLRAAPGIEVVGEAGDGAEAVALAAETAPDVILMDIRMPGINGIEATERILAQGADRPPRILVLTTFDLDEYVYGALRAGAAGFLLKDSGPERLLAAVAAVAAGDALFAPSVTRRLVQAYARQTACEQPTGLDALTSRELEVLELIARGLSNLEIADRLYISEATVKTHLNRTMNKLALDSRAQAVVVAYESGLVTPGG